MDGTEDKRRWKGPPKAAKAGAKSPADLRSQTAPALIAKKLKPSSRAWVERQLNDPYVAAAQRDGYRSRAAYKLLELDDALKLITARAVVVDLGAAPGGWTQAALARGAGAIVGVDLLPVAPIAGARIFEGDIAEPELRAALRAALPGPPDLVLSDMAPNAVGHARTDHLRIVALLEIAVEFARAELAPGGAFVGKIFQGGAQAELLSDLKRDFRDVRHVKPRASRSESAELYLVARGFRGVRV